MAGLRFRWLLVRDGGARLLVLGAFALTWASPLASLAQQETVAPSPVTPIPATPIPATPIPATPTPAIPTQPASTPAVSAPPAPAPASSRTSNADATREIEVIRRDRSRLSGMLIEQTQEKLVMSISGLRTELPMSEVESIRVLASVEERYGFLRESIDPQDVDALLNLARWLRDRERYALSHREVERVLRIEPANPFALEMKRQLEAQMRVLGQSKEVGGEVGKEPGNPGEPVAPQREAPPRNKDANILPPVEREDFPLLTNEQVNLMRVFETDLKDPPRMIIKRGTVEAFLDKYAGTVIQGRGMVPVNPEGRKQFLAQNPVSILSWFFDLRAREFYEEVQVQENPRSMRLFRDNVHRTWLMNSCATTKCHGGEEAGRLYLFNKNPASDRTAYTNFLILERFRTAQGLPLIDYAEPAKSPLLQMGLPREKAIFKHPEAGGAGRRWAPAFGSEDDPRFSQAVQWVRTMFPNRPDYPIEYVAPVPRPLQSDVEQAPGMEPPKRGEPR